MRTVLVCVRTPLAAQTVASAAARLGLTSTVRTAVSDPEVMLRLAERPADVVLADTAVSRPDSVGFVRRVLARSPGAAVLLFGPEDPGTAAAAIAAGARGLIQGGEQDPVSVVAKAILLLSVPGRAGRGPAFPGTATGSGLPLSPRGAARGTADRRPGVGRAPAPPVALGRDADVDAQAGQSAAPTVVPAQRGDDQEPADARRGPDGSPSTDPRGNVTPDVRYVAARRGEPVNGGGPGRGGSGAARRIGLTERELQVLLGMADGKSNAEIGRELFVSEDTVKTHARRLFRKLGARDRAHAVAAGFRAGLVA